MRLYRIQNPEIFDRVPEVAMDIHYAAFRHEGYRYPLIVVGGRVAISIHHDPRSTIDDYLDQRWLQPNVTYEQRVELFETWLERLSALRDVEPQSGSELIQPISIRPRDQPDEVPTLAFIVGPLAPLPSPPPRPGSIRSCNRTSDPLHMTRAPSAALD